MLFHAWDNQSLNLTPVLVYEAKDDALTAKSPDVARLLAQVAEKLNHFSLLPNTLSDYTNRHPWGKIKVTVKRVTNFPFQGCLYCRVHLQPWTLETRKCMELGVTEFNQSFYIPNANHFFTIKVELVNTHMSGVLSAKLKETVLASYEIRIPDLRHAPFDRDGSISLPIPSFDWKKSGLQQIGPQEHVSYLEMQITDMTRASASIYFNPNRNMYEDRPYIDDYSIQDIQTVLTRSRLSISMIDYIICSDRFIFQYWYPRWTHLCWVLMQIFVYFFDMRYLFSYLILGFFWIVLSYSPWWAKHMTPKLERLFFSVEHLHPLIKGGAAIETLAWFDISSIRNINAMI
jgi:hypothetical protein